MQALLRCFTVRSENVEIVLSGLERRVVLPVDGFQLFFDLSSDCREFGQQIVEFACQFIGCHFANGCQSSDCSIHLPVEGVAMPNHGRQA